MRENSGGGDVGTKGHGALVVDGTFAMTGAGTLTKSVRLFNIGGSDVTFETVPSVAPSWYILPF